MIDIYVIVKHGVYHHHVPGYWTTLQEAMRAAARLAWDDGTWGFDKPHDGHHDWEIMRATPGGVGDELVVTVGCEHRRRVAYDDDHRAYFVEATPVGYWMGERRLDEPPHIFDRDAWDSPVQE